MLLCGCGEMLVSFDQQYNLARSTIGSRNDIFIVNVVSELYLKNLVNDS